MVGWAFICKKSPLLVMIPSLNYDFGRVFSALSGPICTHLCLTETLLGYRGAATGIQLIFNSNASWRSIRKGWVCTLYFVGPRRDASNSNKHFDGLDLPKTLLLYTMSYLVIYSFRSLRAIHTPLLYWFYCFQGAYLYKCIRELCLTLR